VREREWGGKMDGEGEKFEKVGRRDKRERERERER